MPELRRPEPPYQQIVKYYRQKIRRGDYQPGDKLPSGREMREEWNVARATASRVSLALQREGLAQSVAGIGLVVTAGQTAADEEVCSQCGRHVLVLESDPVT
jgi:DNA-binding transcriptional regulator YhcF (GntR family)